MTELEKKGLDQQGFIVLEGFMSRDLLEGLQRRVAELFAEEGEKAGSEFKQEPHSPRLANLVNKGEIFERVIAMAEILERIGHVLGERFKLSSLNVRTADPLTGWVQPLHADVGAIADEKGYWVANTVWMLDDFTTDNGALRVVPGSHRLRKLPQQALKDPSASHSDEVLVTGKAGTVIVMNSHMWHGGTANRTAKPRCALHAFYARWDKPQQQYQKRLLAPALQARLSPELRQLLALDDPLNDRLCSEVTSQSGFLR